MPREDKKEEITAESYLGPQFGSDAAFLVKAKHDIRRLSKLNPLEIAWISFFSLEDGVDGKDEDLEGGGGYYYEFCEQYLNVKVSEEGWRINKMIQAIAACKGAPSVGELQKQPNILARNITNRDWKEKAQERGDTIVR